MQDYVTFGGRLIVTFCCIARFTPQGQIFPNSETAAGIRNYVVSLKLPKTGKTAENALAIRTNQDKYSRRDFCHSFEKNMIVSTQLEKTDRADHREGGSGVVSSRIFVHNFF